MMEAYSIISTTENMAHFIFNGIKLGGKINKLAGFPHNMQKNHETPCCLMFKVTKINTGPRKKKDQTYGSDTHQALSNTKMPDSMSLSAAGGWQGIWEKHHFMPAFFLSPPKISAEDVTEPFGPLWPYEPLVWASTAVLVIASESVTAADPHTHATHPRLRGNGHKGR